MKISGDDDEDFEMNVTREWKLYRQERIVKHALPIPTGTAPLPKKIANDTRNAFSVLLKKRATP